MAGNTPEEEPSKVGRAVLTVVLVLAIAGCGYYLYRKFGTRSAPPPHIARQIEKRGKRPRPEPAPPTKQTTVTMSFKKVSRGPIRIAGATGAAEIRESNGAQVVEYRIEERYGRRAFELDVGGLDLSSAATFCFGVRLHGKDLSPIVSLWSTKKRSSKEVPAMCYTEVTPRRDGFCAVKIPLEAFHRKTWEPAQVVSIRLIPGGDGPCKIEMQGFRVGPHEKVEEADWAWPFDDATAARRQEVAQENIKIPNGWSHKTVSVRTVSPGGERLREVAYFKNSVGMDFVCIPPGEFVLGTTEPYVSNVRRATDGKEYPGLRVRLTRPVLMGAHEVTNAQFRKFRPNHVNRFQNRTMDSANQPVIGLSWDDASAFCEWLSKQDNGTYRLPSEAEWEFACRAGSDTDYYWGRKFLGKYCNHADRRCPGVRDRAETDDGHALLAPVGRYPANAFGLFDMAGNAEEFCLDAYGLYESLRRRVDPIGPMEGDYAIVRGGGWRAMPPLCRSAYRNKWSRGSRIRINGFRVVCSEGGLDDFYDPLELNAWPWRVHGANWRQKAYEKTLEVPETWYSESRTLQTATKRGDEALEINYFVNSLGMRLVCVAPRIITLGSNSSSFSKMGEKHLARGEHEVAVDKPYFVGATEVTQLQWEDLMGGNPSKTKGEDLPVHNVSWFDALAFCRKLSEQEGVLYRLPTEPEWEHAAQDEESAGRGFKMAAVAWFPRDNKLREVGKLKPDAWGAFDTLGNVREWCSTLVLPYPYRADDGCEDVRAFGWRSLRGGDVRNAGYKRTSRWIAAPWERSVFTGFRVVTSLERWDASKAVDVEELKTLEEERRRKANDGLHLDKSLTKWPFDAAEANRRQKQAEADVEVPAKWTREERRVEVGASNESVHVTYFKNSFDMLFVVVPAGPFEMGSTRSTRTEDFEVRFALPASIVVIPKPFLLGATEVTHEQWTEIMGRAPGPKRVKKAGVPVAEHYPGNALLFCKKLSQAEGVTYRLPTEAEWEYACRAGRTDIGYADIEAEAWHAGNSEGRMHRVARKRPNPWGLYDMLGNMEEWCSSAFLPYPYSADDGREDANSGWTVHRGGYYGTQSYRCSFWRRDFGTTGSFAVTRVVCTLKPYKAGPKDSAK